MAFGSGNILELVLKIKADASKLQGELSRASGSMSGFTKAAEGIKMGLKVAATAITAFVTTTIGILKVLGNFADATETVNKALIGLASVAAYKLGAEALPMVKQAAIDLTRDGLMTIAEAATGLKNLLQRGFGLEEAVFLMNRFKDAAAFGRQGSLEFGQAIVTATEGLRNENSILVDNAGVTKNVAMMWRDYARSIGVGVESLTLAQRREAELIGIREETNAQLGDANRLTETYSGQVSKLKQSWFELQAELGEAVVPAFKDLVKMISDMLEVIKDHKKEIKIWIENWLSGIKDIVKWLIKMAGWIDKFRVALSFSEKEVRKYIETNAKLDQTTAYLIEHSDAYAKIMKELTIAYRAIGKGSDELKEKYERLKELYGSSAIAVRLLKEAKGDLGEEFRKLVKEEEAERKKTEELIAANDKAREGTEKHTKAVKDNTEATEDAADAVKDYTDELLANLPVLNDSAATTKDYYDHLLITLPEVTGELEAGGEAAIDAGEDLQTAAKDSLTEWDKLADGIQTHLADAFATMLSGAESFSDALKGLWNAIKESFFQMIGQMLAKWVVNFIGDGLNSIINAIRGKGGVNDAITSIGSTAVETATVSAGAMGQVTNSVNTAIGAVASLASTLASAVGWLAAFSAIASIIPAPGSPLGGPPVPGQFHEPGTNLGGGAPPGKWAGKQHGDVITRPTVAMIGENPALNPEFIFNRPQMEALGSMMNQRSISIEAGAIVINGYNKNPKELANEVFDVLTQRIKMNWRGL